MRPSEAAARQLIEIWGQQAPAVLGDIIQAFPDRSRALKAIEIYCGMNLTVPPERGSDALQRMEGRREVFMWLRAVLSLTTDELRQLVTINNGDDDDAS